MGVSEYELVLMLDPEAPDERRDQISTDARGRIEKAGSLKAEKAWGLRKLAYEIDQRTEADYRFFRFATESPLLDELDHNLKITDGVLRFRIFKVEPDSPVIRPPPPVSACQFRPKPGQGWATGPRGPWARRSAGPAASASAHAARRAAGWRRRRLRSARGGRGAIRIRRVKPQLPPSPPVGARTRRHRS